MISGFSYKNLSSPSCVAQRGFWPSMAVSQGLTFGLAEETQFLSMSTIMEPMLFPWSGTDSSIISPSPNQFYLSYYYFNDDQNFFSSSWILCREGIEDSVDGSDNLIQPGRNFTYEIELDDEIGTLWWHANSAWASATVHGAFVILPAANEDYPFPAPTSDLPIVLGTYG